MLTRICLLQIYILQVERYAPSVEPKHIEDDIIKLLNEHADL